MNRRLPLAILLVTLLAAIISSSCDDSPTAPSDLPPSGTLGFFRVEVTGADYWRDFMPVVQDRGPDDGSPLMASVRVNVRNDGPPATLSFSGAVHESGGARHEMTATAVDTATGAPWGGIMPADTTLQVEILLRSGPYLQPGSRVFAVVTFTDGLRRSLSVRAPEGEVRAVH